MLSSKYLIFSSCLLTGVSTLAMAQSDSKTKNHPKPSLRQCAKDDDHCYNTSRFQIGPYLNKDRLFDGSELLVNVSTNREDDRLLLQQYQLAQDCEKLGIPFPGYPRLVISGKLEAMYNFAQNYSGPNTNKLWFDAAELDLNLQATSWVNVYASIDYDPSRTSHQVFMNRAFMTIGNLEKSPVYLTVGRMYVPFGRYASNMVTEPYTQDIGRTRADAVEIGYQQKGKNALHAEVYTYEGHTRFQPFGGKYSTQYGADAGYQYNLGDVSGEFGASYISNLADSNGIQGTIFNNAATFQSQNIPAVDVYGSIAYKQFNLLGEYITALKRFDPKAFAYESQGAKPSGFNTELSYNFKSFNHPSSIAVGYSRTNQAVAMGLPKNSYRVVYNINIWKNTNLALEFRHDVNYSVQEGSPYGAHQSSNAITAQFDFFF